MAGESDIFLVPQDQTIGSAIVPVSEANILVNGYQFDAVTKHSTMRRYRTTRHPVSGGASITDHAYTEPMKFTMTGVLTPYNVKSPTVNAIIGLVSGGGTDGSIFGNLTSLNRAAIEQVRRKFRQLTEFGDRHTLLTIIGGQLQEANMVITGIGDPKGPDMGEAHIIRVDFIQIRVPTTAADIADIVSADARDLGALAPLEFTG